MSHFDSLIAARAHTIHLSRRSIVDSKLRHRHRIGECTVRIAGAAVSATLGIEGYIWPYVRVGQSIYEPPPLWFMVLGYRAPARWVEVFLERQGRYLADIGRGHEERWEMREHALCDGFSVLVPRHPDPALNAQLQSWRIRNARRFLTLGGVDPDDPEVIMSDLPCPLPQPDTAPP